MTRVSFADPSFPVPTRSVWEESRHSWVAFGRDLGHFDPLLNDRPFEFGEHSEHLKPSAAGWRGRVDGLPFEVEITTGGVQLSEEANKILQ